MKKTLLILLIAIGITNVSLANETPGVKLGELVNGTTKITYDRSKLNDALSYLLESEDVKIDSTQIFFEDGTYYLWAMIKDKTKNTGIGKLVFSLEKTKSDLILAAAPKYILRCLADAGCAQCSSSCTCYAGAAGATCSWKRIYVGDDGTFRYKKTFDDLIKNQKSSND